MEKTFIATQKYLIMSPRKIRLVVEMIKKLSPTQAVEKLPFVQKRAGAEVAKVIKSAIASAKNQGVSETDLTFKEIRVGEGPRLKRGIAVSRGRWHPIVKRMSHIRVVLKTNQAKKEEPKVKEEDKKVEKVKKGTKNGTKS
jgi:large subunit ribosomal protein L22